MNVVAFEIQIYSRYCNYCKFDMVVIGHCQKNLWMGQQQRRHGYQSASELLWQCYRFFFFGRVTLVRPQLGIVSLVLYFFSLMKERRMITNS